MSKASFKVRGKLDSAGAEKEGTLTIDRESGKVEVRPRGSRRTYEVTLSRMANWICQNGFVNQPSKSEEADG